MSSLGAVLRTNSVMFRVWGVTFLLEPLVPRAICFFINSYLTFLSVVRCVDESFRALSVSEGESGALLLVMPICRRKFVSCVTVRAGANWLDLRSPLL
jgi:hypothetical protein